MKFNEMLPFLEDSFAFPIHVEHIFFFDNPSKLRCKVVLKNEPQGKRVENVKGNGPKINLLTIGSDQDFLDYMPLYHKGMKFRMIQWSFCPMKMTLMKKPWK